MKMFLNAWMSGSVTVCVSIGKAKKEASLHDLVIHAISLLRLHGYDVKSSGEQTRRRKNRRHFAVKLGPSTNRTQTPYRPDSHLASQLLRGEPSVHR